MIDNVGANTFLIFMGFDVLATIFCFIFIRETKGKNLEHAAGTEWEVVEKSAGDTEQGGKTVDIIGVHDAFKPTFRLGHGKHDGQE